MGRHQAEQIQIFPDPVKLRTVERIFVKSTANCEHELPTRSVAPRISPSSWVKLKIYFLYMAEELCTATSNTNSEEEIIGDFNQEEHECKLSCLQTKNAIVFFF